MLLSSRWGVSKFPLNPLNCVMHLNVSNEVSMGAFHHNGKFGIGREVCGA